MSRILAIVGLVSALACGHAFAQANANSPVCYNDKMLNTNGLFIRTGSGLVFQAYPGSGAKLSSWLPLDKISVCRIGGSAVEITNLSRKNQQVKALRKFN
jgi:hypothetical protein